MRNHLTYKTKEQKPVPEGAMIVGKNVYYEMDSYKTQRNNNVAVIGAAGAGKTRSIVSPNILQATDSYVISDPKANLYKKYKNYLETKGYEVKKIDFINIRESMHYNLFLKTLSKDRIVTQQNITKMAHNLVKSAVLDKCSAGDPFWDNSSEILLAALIAYTLDDPAIAKKDFETIVRLINSLTVNEDNSNEEGVLDRVFIRNRSTDLYKFAQLKYRSFRVAAAKTLKSIQISANSMISKYANTEISMMMQRDDLDIASIGQKKTALFICASDCDRTYDGLVNIVFTQIMNGLVEYADSLPESRLPIPVRFILDDFATNVCINEFPRMISSVRSRGISAMIFLQAESQLQNFYKDDGRTILGSCDTYVYLGGGDIETAKNVSKRSNKSFDAIMNMPVGHEWIFRRGENPVYTEIFDLEPFEKEKMFEAELIRDFKGEEL